MAQHDYVLDNENGAQFRSDINAALAAIVSNNSGSTAPATPYSFQFWIDTSGGTPLLKIRNAGNTAWFLVGPLQDNLGYFSATGGTISGDTVFSSTGYLELPGGTSAQRPGSPAAAMIRYNSDNAQVELYVNSSWQPVGLGLIQSSAKQAENYSIAASVGSSALTIALKNAAGSNASSLSPVILGFRSATVSSGLFNQRLITGSLSIVIPSTATLGHTSAVACPLYLYALDNAGTIELAVSTTLFSDDSVVSTTILNTSSTNPAVMYSATARSNLPVRLLGKLVSNQTTAGTYAAVPTQITLKNHSPLSPNFAVSSSQALQTVTSTVTPTDITGTTVDIVTNGNPVDIIFTLPIPTDPNAPGFISIDNGGSATTSVGGIFEIVRDGTAITQMFYSVNGASSAALGQSIMPSLLNMIDYPPAGKHTYKLRARCEIPGNKVYTQGVLMNVIERAS